MQTFDFNRSFLRFRIDLGAQPTITVTHKMPTTVNNVRINVESRCEIIDRKTRKSTVFLLGASCKTERVGVERDCWLEPNADFCLVMSDQEFLILKSWAQNLSDANSGNVTTGIPLERQTGVRREAWVDSSATVCSARGKRLDSMAEVIRAIQSDRSIVGHTEYDDENYRVILDFPVKTNNFSERESVFQTDTGPIILPDLSPARQNRCKSLIESLDLAFVAFGKANWAEFIINRPTPIGSNTSVNHYSLPRRIEPTQNVLIEVLEPLTA